MRLLNTDTFNIEQFRDEDIPTYAILSHTWDEEEVTFQDMEGTHTVTKKGFEKIKQCCSIAIAHGFAYLWIDTCCIDKTSSAELSEAINSMYHWYQEAEVCYAYLADVQSKGNISESRWFTRGWTLQELIAPSKIIFFNEKWKELGNKADLQQIVSDHTGIPVSILSGDDDLEAFSIAQRMSWAAERKTSRIEDRAYCLMGIFGVNMPLIYGERERAFTRLQEEIMRISDDHSLFAWKSPGNHGGLLATSPAAFIGSHSIVQFNPFHTLNSPSTMSSRGIHLELHFMGIGRQGLGLAILPCKERGGENKLVAIYVRDLFLTMERFKRVQSERLELLDLRKFRSSQYPMRRICIQAGMVQKPKDFGKYDSIDPEKSILDGTLKNFEESTTLLRAAERGLEDIVWLLLTRSDIDVNLNDDSEGRTPLSGATAMGHEAIVKLLLVRGAQPDLEDKSGQTPLSRAIEGHNLYKKIEYMNRIWEYRVYFLSRECANGTYI
jgi:Heterokaryon incompatibility protein (HET)/Ankyrin repeats (3 copies)